MNSTALADDRITGISGQGAVSWPAIFAGAAAAAALSLILLVLGTGLGLSAVSPWSGAGMSGNAISWSTIAWITFMALASSGLGGYLAGRLRVRWISVHTDEVYFRDTAHGLLAWAVATLLSAAVLTSTIGALVGLGVTGSVAAGATMAKGAGAPAATATAEEGEVSSQSSLYAMDSLFRLPAATPYAPTKSGSPSPQVNADTAGAMDASKSEAARIFANSIHGGALPPADQQYAAQLVRLRTGISQQEAEARVSAAYSGAQQKLQQAQSAAKQAADEARKHAAYAALWLFVSLLGGAFFASLMATFGGRRRDLY